MYNCNFSSQQQKTCIYYCKKMCNCKTIVELQNKFIAIIRRRHLRDIQLRNYNTSVIFPCLLICLLPVSLLISHIPT
jgi:hypothetical protein